MAIPSAVITLSNHVLTGANITSTVTFTFSEAVSGFLIDDVVAPNVIFGALSTTDNIVFTATMTANLVVNDNLNTVTITAGSYLSVSTSEAGLGATSSNYTVNTSPYPTITLSNYNLTTTTNAIVTFVFSEAVSGFSAADVSTPNVSLGTITTTDNIVFRATIVANTGILDNTNSITVAAGTYTSISIGALGVSGVSENYTVSTTSVAIPIAAVTEGTASVSGSGAFDEIMKAIVAHLTVEYTARRITSEAYPQVYLGAMQTALTQAVMFVLQKPMVERQADTEVAKKALVERQTKGFDDDAKQKLLKQALDSWSVAYSVAKDANSIPDTIKVNPIDSIMKNAMDSLSIIKTSNPLGEA